METTCHTFFNFSDFPQAADALDLTSMYVGHSTGLLFKDVYVKQTPVSKAKSNIVGLGFSRRNAHSMLTYVQGSVDAWKEGQNNSIETWERKARDVAARMKKLDPTVKKHRKAYRDLSRKLNRFEQRVTTAQTQLKGTPKLCIGSRKLLRKQHHLATNNLTQQQWEDLW